MASQTTAAASAPPSLDVGGDSIAAAAKGPECGCDYTKEKIAKLDFASLYPSNMCKRGLCHHTKDEDDVTWSVVLASGSALKLAAAREGLAPWNADVQACANCVGGIHEQPIGLPDAWACVERRLEYARRRSGPDACILVIESFITDDLRSDRALVVLAYPHRRFSALSDDVVVPVQFRPSADDPTRFDTTVGERIHRACPDIPADNWHSIMQAGGISRHQQIAVAVRRLSTLQVDICDGPLLLHGGMRVFADYPKPGVNFQDIWSLFCKPASLKTLVRAMVNQITTHLPPRVVETGDFCIAGVEMRGVTLGAMIALDMGVPFIPVRKHTAKLPGKCVVSPAYETEYGGGDRFQVQLAYLDAVPHTVVAVDDIIATGGSLATACTLLESLSDDVEMRVDLVLAVLDVPELRPQWESALGKWRVAVTLDALPPPVAGR